MKGTSALCAAFGLLACTVAATANGVASSWHQGGRLTAQDHSPNSAIRLKQAWTDDDSRFRAIRKELEKSLPFRKDGTSKQFMQEKLAAALKRYELDRSTESAYRLMLTACFFPEAYDINVIRALEGFFYRHQKSPASYEWERARCFVENAWGVAGTPDWRRPYLATRILKKEEKDRLNQELYLRESEWVKRDGKDLKRLLRIADELVKSFPDSFLSYAPLRAKAYTIQGGSHMSRALLERAVELWNELLGTGKLSENQAKEAKQRIRGLKTYLSGKFGPIRD